MSNDTIEDVKINAIRKTTENYRIKSYVVFIIIISIIALVLLFLGSFGNDVFGILIFSLIFIIPAVVLFRNRIPNLLPEFIKESVYEIDEEVDRAPSYNISKLHTEYAMIFGLIVLIVGAIFLIIDARNKIEDPMTVYKIFGSVICCIFGGFMLTKLTGEELSLSIDDTNTISTEE